MDHCYLCSERTFSERLVLLSFNTSPFASTIFLTFSRLNLNLKSPNNISSSAGFFFYYTTRSFKEPWYSQAHKNEYTFIGDNNLLKFHPNLNIFPQFLWLRMLSLYSNIFSHSLPCMNIKISVDCPALLNYLCLSGNV